MTSAAGSQAFSAPGTITAGVVPLGSAGIWDAFVRSSRNATFLHERGYMDYHADRFQDHSLLVFADGTLRGLLPANAASGSLVSHGGLTYGGLIVDDSQGAIEVLSMMEAVLDHARAQGFGTFHYKTIPSMYHRSPCEEDRYALFRLGGTLSRRDVLSVVAQSPRLPFQSRRARGARSAQKAGVTLIEETDYAPFWEVLSQNLRARFGVDPVHSLDEITLLAKRFPANIRLFVARVDARCVAGVVVYESSNVAHVQYISANDEGRNTHALDALFAWLLNEVYASKPFFDFGISNEQQGRVVNEGLLAQKQGFGARTLVHDYYTIDL